MRSVHASIRKHQWPHPSTAKTPRQRSFPSGSIGTSRQRLAACGLNRIAAPRMSWPSRKTSALTSTVSPTVRLTGYRPQSTIGSIRWIWILGGGSFVRGRGMPGETFSPSWTLNRVTFPRSSGVLLHPTSLPGGRLGDEAYRFVDWLAAAGQTWWQVLPLGPPDEEGSPYRSASAFAA